MKYAIIGNGIAGIAAAETIRCFDAEGDITMVADESTLPYCRPMISMLLEGAVSREKLTIRPRDYYQRMKIQTVFGDRVTRIDPDRKTLAINSGRAMSYDKLLIASGADPRPITAAGVELKNIFYMRTASHARQMLDVLPGARRALVLGGGLVGFKAAYALLCRGLHVTMLIRSEYPLSMQVDEDAGKMILQQLLSRGLDVRVGVSATAFEGNGTVSAARLSDGSDVPCDLVVIGKGVLPALSFVPKDAIEVDLGIRVDAYMQTTAPDVYAAGDVAESVDIGRCTPWVNAIWPEAVAQGRSAGANMAGRRVGYKGSLSRNVIRIFDMDVMTGGLVDPSDDSGCEVFQDLHPRLKTYRKLVFRGDRLAGFAMVNDIEQGGILISLIQNQTPITISRHKLLSPSFNYKQLLRY